MMRPGFGHVGDPHTHEVAGKKLTTEKPQPTAHFDQAHVDYLMKAFNIGAVCPVVPRTVDDAVAIIGWNSADQGQREVINHIQSLIDQQKSPGA
jgi:hypothetical protein